MHKAVLLQLGVTLLVAAAAAVFLGARGALSAAFGGLAYVLPGFFFVWRLSVASWRGGHATVTALVVGELFKLVSVVGLLALVAVSYRDLHWGAFLIGLVLALKTNLFAFLMKT
ncbi:MAG: ATP synthase subunit I [Azoarcus sp.]|jgi:ATP synthase protein I|nr:ATP synthase subunit I [Azoarcus sp.]